MKKVFLIGWKDVTLAFRDRAALILMLAAPFILTLGLGFVTGQFSGSNNSGISNIPVIIVNQDGQTLGNQLESVFGSDDLSSLVEVTLSDSPEQARQQVNEDQYAAAVIVPAGFTKSVISDSDAAPNDEVVKIEVYKNPTRPTSAGIVETIVEEYTNRVEVGRVGGQVILKDLIRSGLVKPEEAALVGQEIGNRQGDAQAKGSSKIVLKSRTSAGKEIEFNALAYMAPGMALMFLMYTVSNGGRTLLTERILGTLPRLLVSPTTSSQVLGGKIFGIFLTGAAQMLILIAASTLLFQLDWGDPLGVLVLVLAAVFAAVGWGLVITSVAKYPGQVAALGSAIMLVFGILGGSFISLDQMPEWFRWLSRITPNSWGLNGFSTLALGGGLADIREPVFALLAMGLILFGVSVFIFNRKGGMQS